VEFGQVPHAYSHVRFVQFTVQLFVTSPRYVLQYDNRKQRYVPEAGLITLRNDGILHGIDVAVYHIVQRYLAMDHVAFQQLLFSRDFDEERDVVCAIVRFVHDSHEYPQHYME